ncbi:Acetyl-coenzyme A transporter 1 [Halotydeus destructor]|nr:Acetyl-coenzyme A transporter 1 [Halotydeus destructor]
MKSNTGLHLRNSKASSPEKQLKRHDVNSVSIEDDYLEHSESSAKTMSSLRGDYMNIGLLLFLYVLQGIPLGLGGSIPLILQNQKVSYHDQAIFSFVTWPFSVKLIWAPIVDSLYSSKFGRRKSWLVPVQYLIGLFMMVLSWSINDLLSLDKHGQPPKMADGSAAVQLPIDIYTLTGVFLSLNFLAATQDIAVDGWALTMLKRRNVGYASTCNTVGQTAGYFLGNVVFLALESAEFCNKFFRSEPKDVGLITLSGFLHFWGIVFFVSTSLVWLMKSEVEPQPEKGADKESEMGIRETYYMLFKIMKLPAIQLFCGILLTCKMGFAVSDAVTGLKLMENGVKKEHMALMAVPMVPLQILLPWVISRYTAGPRPLDVFLRAYPWRLMFGFVFSGVLWWTSVVKQPDGSFPVYYYAVILLVYAAHQVTVYSCYVALMAFHAKTSDPAIGGTYMTLLNTVTNLGGNWPATLSLWFVQNLDMKNCELTDKVETCSVYLDGYHIENAICIVIGILWLAWGRSKINRLQSLPPTSWKC